MNTMISYLWYASVDYVILNAVTIISFLSVLCSIWQVCEYILGLQKIAGDGFSINATDSLFGETGVWTL